MTVIVAAKRDDIVHFCADSQVANDSGDKFNYIGGINAKLQVLGGDTIVATTGAVKTSQKVIAHPEWFDFDREEGLTKEFLVTTTCKSMFDYFKENNLFINDPGDTLDDDIGLLIAWRDRLFEIYPDLTVIEHGEWSAAGAGSNLALMTMMHLDEDSDLDEQLLDACREAGKYNNTVSAPYILMDTAKLEMRVVEE